MSAPDLTRDHIALDDSFAARRYFRKFRAITGHLGRVAAEMTRNGSYSRLELEVLSGYVQGLARTFDALAMKYHITGRIAGAAAAMTFDAHESGFPVFSELLTMANDTQQAEKHLANMASAEVLKDQMIETIVGDLMVPLKLQFAMSQRLYYQSLLKGGLFWAQNDPDLAWMGNTGEGRRKYLVHWASYDSQTNLPTIYLMEMEDTGRSPLARDQRRWPEVQRHLSAQALGGLKLLTIAHGFDRDFDDLHPKRLRRIHVGPMYSASYTMQSGPLHEVLEEANAPEGQDWALAWTVEDLESERVETEPKGWFGEVEREVFALDPFSGRGVDTGATRMDRAIILPERPYQVLAEKTPPGFRGVLKFVVSAQGRVLSYR